MRKPQLTKGGKRSNNCWHGKWRKSRAKKRASTGHKKKDHSFCCADGLVPPQGLEQMFRTCEGRDVLRGDVACAVFAEQGSSASRGMSKNAKLREKHKWAIEKPKLDNARRLRGVYFIDPEDEEFKETIENARKKLETPMAPAMPCKINKKSKYMVRPVTRRPMSSNQNMRVLWKLVNLQDCVWENHCRFIMKTIMQEKETIHCSITIWYTKLFLCTKPWKFPQQRQQWTRNGKNWRKFRRGT